MYSFISVVYLIRKLTRAIALFRSVPLCSHATSASAGSKSSGSEQLHASAVRHLGAGVHADCLPDMEEMAGGRPCVLLEP